MRLARVDRGSLACYARAMRSCARRAVVAITLVLATAIPARANFHLAVIDEVMAGCGADPAMQFVEIRMTSNDQNFVGGSTLTAFNCDGSEPRRTLLAIPAGKTVSNTMAGGRWIMASSSFQAASGIAPDFVITNPGIFPDCGQVCWGKPSNPDTTNAYVDCVAYGPYTGPPAPQGSPVSSIPNNGTQSLTRTGGGSNTFALAAPTPTNAMGQQSNLSACPLTTTTSIVPSSTTSTTTSGGTGTTIGPALLGGGAAKTDCFAGWHVVGASTTAPAVRCTDNDPSCDLNPEPGCRVSVSLCFDDAAEAIYGGKCSASPVTAFALTGTPDPQNAAAVTAAVQALPGAQAADGGTSFTPPIGALTCTSPIELEVPLRVKGTKTKKGVRALKSLTTADKRDKDKLKILCIP
jgi:hypothetical protein